MARYKPKAIRGMHDLLPREMEVQSFIINNAKKVAIRYGFEEISTPIVEEKELFCRTLGEDSDVISKELYSWTPIQKDSQFDKPKEYALRPEGTAGIVRALISPSPKLYHQENQKPNPIGTSHRLFYAGPMFRFERPQKGRYRQFEQVGVEWIGEGAKGATADTQMLSMAHHFLSSLNIKYKLKINTLGNNDERAEYRKVLMDFFEKNKSDLSDLSRQRLERGSVLRILDSKDLVDREISQNAPKLIDSLQDDSKKRFGDILTSLETINISYEVDPFLVRGLDYYSHTIFEFLEDNQTASNLGSQNTILAGGRYDDLPELLGSVKLHSIGWAAGVDRLALILDKSLIPAKPPTVAIVILREASTPVDMLSQMENLALKLSHNLCELDDICVLFAGEGTAKKQMSRANKYNAAYTIIIGESEILDQQITLKDMINAKQEKVPIDKVLNAISSLILKKE